MGNKISSAIDVANFVIYLANEQVVGDGDEREGVTNLKLQKILYFVEAYCLSVKDRSIFNEPIVAWEYGPVVLDVYYAFKKNGSDLIFPDKDYKINLSEEDQDITKAVWEDFSKFSASRLVTMTHRHKPWIDAYQGGKTKGAEISREKIKEYYTGLFI